MPWDRRALRAQVCPAQSVPQEGERKGGAESAGGVRGSDRAGDEGGAMPARGSVAARGSPKLANRVDLAGEELTQVGQVRLEIAFRSAQLLDERVRRWL